MALINVEDTINHNIFNTKNDPYVTISLSAVGNSDWYKMPDGIQFTEVELNPVGGTAVVQATIDYASAETDSVDGIDWTDGVVSSRTQSVLNGSAAIRLKVISGTADLFLKGVKA